MTWDSLSLYCVIDSYVNHSCAPNCVAEVVTFDKEDKIIIISSRRIPKGEEVRTVYTSLNELSSVIDASLTEPFCVFLSVSSLMEQKLTYDYQFDFEDDQHKIPCHCGAWNCRKWMN